MTSIDSRQNGASSPETHPLRGLVVTQAIGAFNDNAWKQIVVLLAINLAASESAAQEQAAFAQAVLMIPLMLVSLPAGLLADRLSKRTVIIAMKMVELAVMIMATLVLFYRPEGGTAALGVLMLLGLQAALFSPAKYGILPEILPHHRLSAGNGLLELWSNLAVIGGTVAGGVLVSLTSPHVWVAAAMLVALSGCGLVAALGVPRVPAARSEGALGETIAVAWKSIREDRVLRLAVQGQLLLWSVASLIPAPVLSYASKTLHLEAWQTGIPLAALGLGIGLGSVAAGRLSAANVEYGLLPLGALGLTLSTFAFGVFGPGVVGTILLMGVVGVFSGLLFVPLNALVQWRAPRDRRGAVIALVNALVFAGMLAGSLLAMVAAWREWSARETFLATSLILGGGFFWALSLVPDAFLRFILILLAHTIYRLRVVGRTNIPATGGALLTPNHVSFADGLFVIASTDRPVRFVVYANYFNRPLMGWFLRSMKAIPISSRGGPRTILNAFREAGHALDEGELVCIFPEGQITRTGMTQPFRRGLERIVKGRTIPIIPVHLDRATASIFSPLQTRRLPERLPLPITVSFGGPLPSTTPLHEIRRAVAELDREAWDFRKEDRWPLHHEFIRHSRRHPFRLAMADFLTPRVSSMKALSGSIIMARALRKSWEGQANVGVLLPTSVVASLVNLAAVLSGRVSVNLNFTTGPVAMGSAARQARLQTVVTSRTFLEKARVELPQGLTPIWIEEIRDGVQPIDRFVGLLLAWLAPVRQIERAVGATQSMSIDDPVTIIFSSGSTGEPKGVVLSHFNIDSNVESIAQVFRARPDDRVLDILPLFHSFGYLIFWLAMNRGLGLICHANPLEAAAVGELVHRYNATILLATPTFLQLYLRRVAPAQFGSLRLVIVGAEKLPEPLARSFEETFGIRPLEGYGMTECSPVVAVSTLDYRAPGFFQPGSRRGFVGQPLPGVSVRVVDPDTGDPVGPNVPGMVLVRGPNVMSGYLDRHDLTSTVFQDGWYVTGDIGLVDEDGFLKITGRLSRFSKIGGEMVPHGRVEEALQTAAASEDQVFAVTAVNDGRGGERLAVLHTLPDEKLHEAQDRLPKLGLPNLFLPRRDHFVRVDKLPFLGTGKLDLRAVKRIAEETLSPQGAESSTTTSG